MIEAESVTDLLVNAEPGFYMDCRGWIILALILSIAAWALWSEARCS